MVPALINLVESEEMTMMCAVDNAHYRAAKIEGICERFKETVYTLKMN